MQILGYYQQLSKRFTCFVIVQYWSHPYIDKVHNINKNPYAKYQNNYSEYIYDWKKLIYLFSQIFHIFFINSYLIFFALKESAESLLSKSVWVYVFLMYTKNITTQKLVACLILWEKTPTPSVLRGLTTFTLYLKINSAGQAKWECDL